MKAANINAAITLVIALMGAGWAYAIHERLWVAIIAPAVLVGLGELLFITGKGKIKKKPEVSVCWMEWRFLMYLFVAVLGSGAVIIVAAVTTPDVKWDPVLKGIVTAASGAVGVALASLLVGKGDNPWSNWVDKPIEAAFQKKFTAFWKPDSRPRDAVFSDNFEGCDGWGREARRVRAKAIAEALQNGTDIL
ncbi:hypothetical protein [Streptomyces sp. NPDC040750]|uniref:hypothetical protein n=1 Tax=Streptomyces sp. NPDC040750 TaxID=3154491 RepID=UPI0033E8C7B0